MDTSKNDYNSLPYDIQTGKITDIKISPDEKILAVASISNSNPQVDMYIRDKLDTTLRWDLLLNYRFRS